MFHSLRQLARKISGGANYFERLNWASAVVEFFFYYRNGSFKISILKASNDCTHLKRVSSNFRAVLRGRKPERN